MHTITHLLTAHGLTAFGSPDAVAWQALDSALHAIVSVLTRAGFWMLAASALLLLITLLVAGLRRSLRPVARRVQPRPAMRPNLTPHRV